MTTPTENPDKEWWRATLRPECPACGGYLLPCTETATGIHPGLEGRLSPLLHREDPPKI